MNPPVPLILRNHRAGHHDPRKRLPRADNPVRPHLKGQAHLPDKHIIIPVDHKSQRRVRRVLMKHDLASGHGKAESGGIDKLGVFLRHMAVAVLLTHPSRVRHNVFPHPVYQHIRLFQHLHRLKPGKRLCLCPPELMVVRQRQAQKTLHPPVRGSGGVVPLRHDQVRICVPNGQHPVPVTDLLLIPPA